MTLWGVGYRLLDGLVDEPLPPIRDLALDDEEELAVEPADTPFLIPTPDSPPPADDAPPEEDAPPADDAPPATDPPPTPAEAAESAPVRGEEA